MTDETFREKLIDWMQRNDFSDSYVASAAAVSVSAVQGWRKGVFAPRPLIKRFVLGYMEENDAFSKV